MILFQSNDAQWFEANSIEKNKNKSVFVCW